MAPAIALDPPRAVTVTASRGRRSAMIGLMEILDEFHIRRSIGMKLDDRVDEPAATLKFDPPHFEVKGLARHLRADLPCGKRVALLVEDRFFRVAARASRPARLACRRPRSRPVRRARASVREFPPAAESVSPPSAPPSLASAPAASVVRASLPASVLPPALAAPHSGRWQSPPRAGTSPPRRRPAQVRRKSRRMSETPKGTAAREAPRMR